MKEDQLFQERFKALNANQQLSVSTTEGPVMVIAGPGTGKTEVLGMRIANLLRSAAQVAPHEILCLTYTEEAAFNMRKRLSTIVGVAAQKVNIHTFHGFCNSIIQNNSEYFGIRQMELISDIERVELLQNLIAQLPYDNPMHRIGASTFYDLKPLLSFFTEVKQENWSETDLYNAIESYIQDLPNREAYVYKRKSGEFNIGDPKQKAIDEEVGRMERTKAAVELYKKYNGAMKGIGRYDYADMILFVIEAFKKNECLLQNYQERFQYILVDEFQDTNGAQNEILNMLTSYWGESANIFVVGDDDQSIYEFQGARIQNIVDFYEKYKTNIQVFLLTDNYRSSDAVLELAMNSINNNKQRLTNSITGLKLDKKIKAALPRFQIESIVKPQFLEYKHPLHEAFEVTHQIIKLQEQGVPLDSVAIIYAQHKNANYLISILERKGIPFVLRKSINVLDEIIPSQVLKIFEYLLQESKKAFSGEALLFELLHAPYFGIYPKDIAALSIYLASKEAKEKNIKYWRQLFAHEMILSSLEIQSLKQILHVARALDSWLQQLHILRIPMLLEKIVYESNIVQWCLKGNQSAWDMQVLQSFFDFVQSVSTPQTQIPSFLDIIEKMKSEGINLPLQRIFQQKGGVHLYTAHSAKGLEFEHVFLIGCEQSNWEKKKAGNGAIKFPDTLTRTVDENNSEYKIEVARRLFYVAMTRAKKHLYISYSSQNMDAKSNQVSLFIEEILSESSTINAIEMTEEILEEVGILMEPINNVIIELVDRGLMEKQFENFKLSPSSLNKYLECPIRFYYEDVLRTPTTENDSMAFGTAIHYALERAFKEMLKSPNKTFPSQEETLGYFKFKMQDKELAFTKLQFERRLEKGIEILRQFYQDHVNSWEKNVQLETQFQANIGKVPIKGRIDKIELLTNNDCRVVDYKTGNPDHTRTKENLAAPNEKNNFVGGNYWRQMVFYKLLVEGQPFNKLKVGEGVFEYIEKSKLDSYSHKVIILPKDEQHVVDQILTTYERITRFEFEKGCQSSDCSWCNFVKTNGISIK